MENRKRVCHVTSAHLPFDGRIFERECVSLAKKYEVYLIVPNIEDCERQGVHILGVKMPTGRFSRQFHLKDIYKRMIEVNADIYQFHEPELIRYGLKIRKHGKKIVFDSHENVPAQILKMEYLPSFTRGLVSKLYIQYEKRALKKFSGLISVDDAIVGRLKIINPNTYLIANFPKLSEFDTSKRPWKRVVCFAGLLTPDWKLGSIINVLPKTNSHLYLAGLFSTEDYLNELKALPGWTCVTFLGTIPHQQVLELYGNCSIGLAIGNLENPNGGYKTGSLGCTKIPEYLSTGMPIIVSNDETWAPIVRENKCGIVINNPNDETEIANAITTILNNPEEAKSMGERGKEVVAKSFNWKSQESTLFEMYSKMLSD